MAYSSSNTIMSVAAREIRQSLRSRGIMVTLSILLIVLVAGPFIGAHFLNQDSDPSERTIVLVGIDPSPISDPDFLIEAASNPTDVESRVRDGDIAAAFIHEGEQLTFVHDGQPSPRLQAFAQTLQHDMSLSATLNELGLSAEQFAAATPTIELVEKQVDNNVEPTPDRNEWDLSATLGGIFILMMSVTLFAANVGARVTEEKSSRIIELIVATVKPLDFLAGKIIGNVSFAVAATAAVLGVGTLSLRASGILHSTELNWSLIPVLFVSYFLGLLFFSSMYAAAGAMVQRTEDLQSTQMPIMLLIFVIVYTPATFFSQVDSDWMYWLAWIPPLSVGHAPLQYAAGNFSTWQFCLSMFLLLAFTTATIWLVARIYRIAILHNSSKLTWRQALRLKG
ncbi:ABC transporter permease [Corynebacterium lizhenjunii]|uniref:ABC transporter permease n=1 Tax=Corynebacterium lizhenjunii TaxID=2709394 RepID=A0A7T0KEX9_9CORY|nr:ABC transporter permease [Corynebacterium lizhenjunii]QPK79076.1 ABC transporter permease [Corynebacterium lizhenjunii]